MPIPFAENADIFQKLLPQSGGYLHFISLRVRPQRRQYYRRRSYYQKSAHAQSYQNFKQRLAVSPELGTWNLELGTYHFVQKLTAPEDATFIVDEFSEPFIKIIPMEVDAEARPLIWLKVTLMEEPEGIVDVA